LKTNGILKVNGIVHIGEEINPLRLPEKVNADALSLSIFPPNVASK